MHVMFVSSSTTTQFIPEGWGGLGFDVDVEGEAVDGVIVEEAVEGEAVEEEVEGLIVVETEVEGVIVEGMVVKGVVVSRDDSLVDVSIVDISGKADRVGSIKAFPEKMQINSKHTILLKCMTFT